MALLGLLGLSVGCAGRTDEESRGGATDFASAAVRVPVQDTARARQDSINRARPDYVVDSARTPDEELARYRKRLGAFPTALSGGATSRDALLASFRRALAAGDSAGLAALAITEAEFVALIYPTSRFARPPYYQPPDVQWMLLRGASDVGLGRLLRRGSPRARDLRFVCPGRSVREGATTLWPACRAVGGDFRKATRLFGQVVSRDGRYKFATYANDF